MTIADVYDWMLSQIPEEEDSRLMDDEVLKGDKDAF